MDESRLFFSIYLAEGLLDAVRLAHSLRSGPPSRTTAFNSAGRPSCRTRLFFCRGLEFLADG